VCLNYVGSSGTHGVTGTTFALATGTAKALAKVLETFQAIKYQAAKYRDP
jgi:hypothetical protein